MGVSAIANNCPLLKSIDLHGCNRITDVGISAIAHNCPLLNEIDFSYNKNINKRGVSAFGHKWSCLSYINGARCIGFFIAFAFIIEICIKYVYI